MDHPQAAVAARGLAGGLGQLLQHADAALGVALVDASWSLAVLVVTGLALCRRVFAGVGGAVDPDRPAYPLEYAAAKRQTRYDDYGQGPRRVYEGDAKRSIRVLEKLPEAAREPSVPDRGLGVIHPPLYPPLLAPVDAAMGDASILSRLTVMRFVSALVGGLAVYLAWLLAAQVLPRFRLQIAAALLASLQPVFSYMTGVVNHDVLLVAGFSAALAMMAFICRTAPARRQGLWLGERWCWRCW